MDESVEKEINGLYETVAETIGYDSLGAEIVDGKMVITPADAGVHLIAYVTMSEARLDDADAEQERLNDTIEELRTDNSVLRDLLERCYAVLLEAGQVELADEVITAAYPVKGITEIGTGE
jgi:hypothetical protein